MLFQRHNSLWLPIFNTRPFRSSRPKEGIDKRQGKRGNYYLNLVTPTPKGGCGLACSSQTPLALNIQCPLTSWRHKGHLIGVLPTPS